jgi:hypothetical protein
MKAVYYTTRNFIRHEGNVIDLAEYRRRLAQVDGSLALAQPEEVPEPRPERRRTHPKARRRRLADWLDMAASAITVAVVTGLWVQLML